MPGDTPSRDPRGRVAADRVPADRRRPAAARTLLPRRRSGSEWCSGRVRRRGRAALPVPTAIRCIPSSTRSWSTTLRRSRPLRRLSRPAAGAAVRPRRPRPAAAAPADAPVAGLRHPRAHGPLRRLRPAAARRARAQGGARAVRRAGLRRAGRAQAPGLHLERRAPLRGCVAARRARARASTAALPARASAAGPGSSANRPPPSRSPATSCTTSRAFACAPASSTTTRRASRTRWRRSCGSGSTRTGCAGRDSRPAPGSAG